MSEEERKAACAARWATDSRSHRQGDPCEDEATEWIADMDLCLYHYRRAIKWFYRMQIELPEKVQRQIEAAKVRAAEQARLDAEARSIVYYLRRHSDGHIKIGTTTGYKVRLKDLRGEHGPLSLLLAYAGGREEEDYAHKTFAAAHVTGEWFRPDLPLLLAILRMRNGTARRENRLPVQVPRTEIRALIKATRARQKVA